MIKIRDRELRKALNGKRIVIIGGGPVYPGNKWELIYNYDYIVRLNNYKTKGYEKLIGNRIDIFYSYFGRNIVKSNDDLKSDGLKFIMCKYPNADFTRHMKGKVLTGHSDTCTWVYKLRSSWWRFPVWIPKLEYFRENYNLIERIPTTGIAAVLVILRFEPAELYITCYDFFVSKKHNADEPWIPGDGNHNIVRERELIKKLIMAGKIKADNNILKICNV